MRCYAFIDIDNKKAREDCYEAIKLNDSSASAYNNFGVAADKLGYFNEAILNFNKAIDLDKQLAIAYWNIFVSKTKLGDKKSACDDVKKSAYLGSRTAIDWIQSEDGTWCRNLR